MNVEFFATAAKGTEPALRDELRELRVGRVRCDRGGVHFVGEWEGAFKACLHSRIALRVYHPLARFEVLSDQDLYDGVRAVDWSDHLMPEHSLAFSSFCRDSSLTHTNYISQKAKDALVDQQRDRFGERSSVDRKEPDLKLFVHLVKNQATLYLDLAGESLHRRGYRNRTVQAPLKENLAAALLRLSGWDRKRPLLDPMCGSGTIAIEAAMWGRNIAPGLSRQKFSFEGWPKHDKAARQLMAGLREQAAAAILDEGPEILAGDWDPQAISASQANARAAGVDLNFVQRSVMELSPTDPPGMIVSNPPYGKRLEIDEDFYVDLGARLRSMHKHRLGLLLTQKAAERALGLKKEKFWILHNGDIECRLFTFEIR